MGKETLLATSPSLQDLRRLIAEYYFTGLDSIKLVDGFIYKKIRNYQHNIIKGVAVGVLY